VIPGVIATQHSDEGKANQYFLRGFNLDHGTDFSATVDGVPINLRTHGHGQGYLDLNFIIPVIVERVEFRKGPYSASNGDFSAAGSSKFTIRDHFDQNFAEITLGENNYARGIVGASGQFGDFDLLLAGEGQVYDGPWALEPDLEKINAVLKLTRESENSTLSLEFFGYDSSWTSTDQIPQRAVESGLIDGLGFIDDDLGGETSRYSTTLKVSLIHGDGSATTAQTYLIGYDFRLVSNFTYLLEDPTFGDEFVQRDRRQIHGAQIGHVRPFQWDGRSGNLRLGAETRFDDVSDIGLFRSVDGVETSAVRQDQVEELSLSGFAEVEVPLTDRLRATLGGRFDYYDATVNALTLPANGGSSDDTLFSPSMALAWRATDALELYANYGRGFHSNDVRGATITVDPASGDPVDQVDLLVAAEGAELGARLEKDDFNTTLSLFALEVDSELVFVGDAGTTEPNQATRRFGIEVAAFGRQPTGWWWTPAPHLLMLSSVTLASAAMKFPARSKACWRWARSDAGATSRPACACAILARRR
jgi:outer membrane receptor protein involved in Fe transport